MRTITPKNANLIPKNAEKVFGGQIFDVYHWQQKMFDGSESTFEMLKRPDTIKIIAVKDNRIVILDEQQPNDHHFLDFPGGRHDQDKETELDAAKRELLEETGMSFAEWKLVHAKQPHTKIDWFVYIFVATDFIDQTEQKLDSGEKIEVKLVEFNELKEILQDPKARYLPKEILEKCNSAEDILNLPEYKD